MFFITVIISIVTYIFFGTYKKLNTSGLCKIFSDLFFAILFILILFSHLIKVSVILRLQKKRLQKTLILAFFKLFIL